MVVLDGSVDERTVVLEIRAFLIERSQYIPVCGVRQILAVLGVPEGSDRERYTVKKDILNIFANLMSVKIVLKFRSVKSETFLSKDFCTCLLFYDINILIISRGTSGNFPVYFNIW